MFQVISSGVEAMHNMVGRIPTQQVQNGQVGLDEMKKKVEENSPQITTLTGHVAHLRQQNLDLKKQGADTLSLLQRPASKLDA
jgi:capsule polysaccharide export protein KpsE/RkpR